LYRLRLVLAAIEKTVRAHLLVAFIMLLFCGGVYTYAAESTVVQDTGQYVLRPRRRFDIRQQLRQLDGDTHLHITTFRFDLPMSLDEGRSGILAPRIDIPIIASDLRGNDNPNGDTYEYAGGDLLTQFVYIYPESEFKDKGLDGVGIGAQLIWPVAGKSVTGSEKYQAAPLVAAKWKLPQVSKGSFVAPIFRYFMSYADRSDGGGERDDVSELSIQPYFYVDTKEWGWPVDFVNFWATEDIVINFEDTDSKDSGNMFFPIDVMVGKMLNENTVVSVEFSTPIVNDYDLYDWLVEFRIGFFF
jgi:hypothetical protein